MSLTDDDSTVTFQPLTGGVGEVHLGEVAGEQVRFLAALGAADLDDDVLAVVRVGRQHQLAELGRRVRPARC